MSRISDLAGFTTAISTTEDLSVGIITASSFSGNLTGDVTGDVTGNADTATNAAGLTGTPNISVGSVNASSGTISGNLSIGGTLTYQDVTNVDAVGMVTARKGIQVLADGINVTGVSTFNDNVNLQDNDYLQIGSGNDLQIYHNSVVSRIDNNVGVLQIRNLLDNSDISLQTDNGSGGVAEYVLCDGSSGSVILKHYGTTKFETDVGGVIVTGVVTATSFSGSGENLTNLPASGDSNDITASLFI